MMAHMFDNGYYGNWEGMPGGVSAFGPFFGLMHFITWALIIALLLGIVRWVWKKGDKVK